MQKMQQTFPNCKILRKTWKNMWWFMQTWISRWFLWETLNTFQKLKKCGIDIENHNKFFDHFIVFDFETILSKTEIKKTNHWDLFNLAFKHSKVFWHYFFIFHISNLFVYLFIFLYVNFIWFFSNFSEIRNK